MHLGSEWSTEVISLIFLCVIHNLRSVEGLQWIHASPKIIFKMMCVCVCVGMCVYTHMRVGTSMYTFVHFSGERVPSSHYILELLLNLHLRLQAYSKKIILN